MMQRKTISVFLALFAFAWIGGGGCRGNDIGPVVDAVVDSEVDGETVDSGGDAVVPAGLPTVNTLPVTEITDITAQSGGNVTEDGGYSVIERGILWSKSPNPTVEDNEGLTSDGQGTGEFTSKVTGLLHETTYYLRAYATNSAGVAYGNEIEFTTLEREYEPGVTHYGTNKYVKYIPGNISLIISAPHGGYEEPDSIPDRDCGTTTRDSYTQELTNEIMDIIYERTGCHPHIIINKLHRRKLDPNRAMEEATCGNTEAEVPYIEFHNYLHIAKDRIESIHGKGLLLDMHGHAHEIQRLELGYTLSASELRLVDDDLNTPTYIDKSSIRSLVYNNLNDYSLTDFLRGFYSLGEMLSNEGIAAMPGILDPWPLPGEPYFSGGYITRVHGSRDSGTIDAIQVECNQDVRFNTSARLEFAAGFVEAVFLYIDKHYFEGFAETICDPLMASNKSTGAYPSVGSNLYQKASRVHPLDRFIESSTIKRQIEETASRDLMTRGD